MKGRIQKDTPITAWFIKHSHANTTKLGQWVYGPSAEANRGDTEAPLPATGKWSIRATRPDNCPHDSLPCARVIYSVPESHVMCEWTVIPQQGAAPAVFIDQNADASRFLLRRASGEEIVPLLLASPQPIYPPIARAARISGSVVVRLVVSDKGVVTVATPLSGPDLLRQAAADAAKHYTFRALHVGTQPIPFTVDVVTEFTVEGKPHTCTEENPCATLPNGKVTIRP